MPSFLILRKHKSAEEVELAVENVETLSVKDLKETAATKLEVPLEELKLVYGGRVLKTGKGLVDYKVTAGCTIFALAIKPRKEEDLSITASSGGDKGLMNNPRVLAVIGRVLGNSAILQEMAQGIAMATGNPAVLDVLGNQQLLQNISDPENLREYIRDRPSIAVLMEQVIRQFLGSDSDNLGEEELVDMLESHVEEEMEEAEIEGEEQRTHAQEQMFQHSQALQAHNQQQLQQQQPSHTSTQPSAVVQDMSYNPVTSHQYGSVSQVSRQNSGTGITQDQLASALATAFGSSPQTQTNSPVASLNHTQLSNSLSQQPLAPPPSYTSTVQPFNTASQAPSAINSASLQQALANVRPPAPPTSGMENGHTAARYSSQLEQLRLMGITDETACLHALAAAGGDLQAALEILYSL